MSKPMTEAQFNAANQERADYGLAPLATSYAAYLRSAYKRSQVKRAA